MNTGEYDYAFGDWTFRQDFDDRSWKDAIEELLVFARYQGGDERCIRHFYFGDGTHRRHIRNFCRKFATDEQYREQVLNEKIDWTPWMNEFWERCRASYRGQRWGDLLEMQRFQYFHSRKVWEDQQKALTRPVKHSYDHDAIDSPSESPLPSRHSLGKCPLNPPVR